MGKSYEELMGALGRAMFFRPERRRVREILSYDANPVLLIEGQNYPLFDVSMNGMSFATPGRPPWNVGDEVPLELHLHGEAVYTGRARVARIETVGKGSRVALALITGFLDLPEVRRRDEEARLRRELDGGSAAVMDRVPAAYREAVTRAVHFVQYHRQSLARHEARYRAEGKQGIESLQSLPRRAADALRPAWRAIDEECSRAGTACLEAAPEVLRAAKVFTETVFTPLLADVPMVRRAYGKPLGYPGDYQVMLYYYDNAFEGETAAAKVFHKYFVEHPLSNGVVTRKDYVAEMMAQEHRRVAASKRQGGPFRVTSLGCGPAREVTDYINHLSSPWPGPALWTLIDQEEETLSIAFHEAGNALGKRGVSGELQCLNLSFGQLLNEPALLNQGPEQDFVYSTGLFDYLRESRAQALVSALYGRLAPGGLLAIGNALGPNEWYWSAEFVLDWTLLYRSRDEMHRLAATLPKEAKVDVTVEPGKAYYFLLVRRPE
jgi:extracellular factor (EF) 3-hydroxypalmitic acid methyl ester biosynthesis protein